ncbi:MAG: response regulator transcription factor [Gammaproteobacteria bacterium]|nr:response regulator transcription factor [Gammaproteobacteria bacterium]
MNILLVDDHALFRAGMRYVLKELDQDMTLHEANECKQALELVGTLTNLDLILLDLNMPGIKGFACVNQILLSAKDVPVIVLSADDRLETIHHAKEQGVHGYIQKSDNSLEMLKAIRDVLSGKPSFPLGETTFSSQCQNIISKLTARQREILSLIVEGKANKQIAATLGITEGTTRIHVTTIFKALGVRSRSEAIYKALELGLNYNENA